MYKALSHPFSHPITGLRLCSPSLKQPKSGGITWLVQAAELAKSRVQTFHWGLPPLDPMFLPWRKLWPFALRELGPCPLSLALPSEKLFHDISSVDFDLLGQVSFWTFVLTEEWDKMNSQVTRTAVGSVILFQEFRKEIKVFIWNAWYKKYPNNSKELFIWDHPTTCCDRRIRENERGHWENDFTYFTYALILSDVLFQTSVCSTLPHKAVFPESSLHHHASSPHVYKDCFSFWTQPLLLWFCGKSPFWVCGVITPMAMDWS